MQKVELIDGKMIHGTELFFQKQTQQLFFCPEENTKNRCLVPKTFGENERLQCASEPTPDIQSKKKGCGGDKMSIFYTSLYSVSQQ